MLNLIKDYQTLLGSFIGAFSPVALWFLYKFFEKKAVDKDCKKEIKKIFLTSFRECEDSINNLQLYIKDLEKDILRNNKKIKIILPPKLNRLNVNEERLIAISKNLDHFVSQQVDIASSAVKKFNGWLDQFEKMPEFIFDGNLKILQSGMTSKELVINEYYYDLDNFVKTFSNNIEENSKVIQLHLLRPVFVMQESKKNIKKLFYSNNLENYLDLRSNAYILKNKGFQ